MEGTKEACRELRFGSWLESAWRDICYGLRLLRKSGFALVVLAGVAIGGLAAAAASRMIASVLYGVSALDIGAYAAGCAVMIAVAFLASYLPARSATRVDPAVALRNE